MNIYLLEGTASGYDTFDSMVVIAESEEEAKQIHPYGNTNPEYNKDAWIDEKENLYTVWAMSPEEVTAHCIGIADPNADKGIVVSSFNAG